MTARTLSSLVAALLLSAQVAARADVPPGTAHVDSATLPIRVYYDAAFPVASAQDVLSMVEKDWNVQVGQMGFSQPWRLVDGNVEQGLAVWVTSNTPMASTYEATADVPATAQTDCAGLVIVSAAVYNSNKQYLEFALDIAIYPVLLFGAECVEPYWALEMWAFAAAQCEGREALMGTDVFQAHPEYAFDRQPTSAAEEYYTFGAALLPLFLEERFGARDGKLLGEIWRHAAQNGTVTTVGKLPSADVANAPSYLGAADEVLKAKGSSFDKAFEEFSLWRTLTGQTWSDDRHFQEANSYPEITWTASHSVAELPVKTVHPATKVSAYGSSHVLFDMTGASAGKALKVSVAGTSPYHWAANALCMRAGAGAEVVPLEVDAKTRAGSAVVPDASRCKAIALVVANLSDGTYDANYPSTTNDGDYTYNAAFLDMPTIASISPTSLAQGLHGQSISVKGTSFTDGPKLAASFGGTGVAVESVQLLDTLTYVLTVSVDDAAPLGARDLSLTTGQGLPASMPAALLVTEKPVPPDASVEYPDAAVSDASEITPDAGSTAPPVGHGGCDQSGAGLPISLVAGLAVLFAALQRRVRAPVP